MQKTCTFLKCLIELNKKGYFMAELLFPKPTKEKKEREGSYYFNSTIKIKETAKKKTSRQTPIKCKQMTARKLKSPYHSVFTKDMNRCLITGSTFNVHPHHIFGASLKSFSEKYGFMLPIVGYLHEGTKDAIHCNREMDLKWKRKCEEYWLNTLKKTKEEWLEEAKKWW